MALLLSACSLPASGLLLPRQTEAGQPLQIVGELPDGMGVEAAGAVMLVDMRGFVVRDPAWQVPIESQSLGHVQPGTPATYSLLLPLRPGGVLVDVDQDDQADVGVQVFAVMYRADLYGGPYAEGPDRLLGWPASLSSVKVDPGDGREVRGGALLVWAPDGDQRFPAGFGQDRRLFTADDPLMPLPPGYSLVSLEEQPFIIWREPKPTLPLHHSADPVVDLSGESYSQAFAEMLAHARAAYAPPDTAGWPDWDALERETGARVAASEAAADPQAYYRAIRDFTWSFMDGSIEMDGGSFSGEDFAAANSGGFGFALRQLDDGRVLVIAVQPGGPAEAAGMRAGAEVTAFEGRPIAVALAAVRPWTLPDTSDFSRRYQQVRYLLSVPTGTRARVSFSNPGAAAQTAVLTASAERESFARTSLYYGLDRSLLFPVEARIITQGDGRIGYIKVHDTDDPRLSLSLFERALGRFEQQGVRALILDLRHGGSRSLGLAGFLLDQAILLGQRARFDPARGQFVPSGPYEALQPFGRRYAFEKKVLLVGPACSGGCELDAFGLNQVPGLLVVGQYPTAGVGLATAYITFRLPEGLGLTFPTERLQAPSWMPPLEGRGVAPALKVPVDESTELEGGDAVLDAGIRAILQPGMAGIAPAAPPQLLPLNEVARLLDQGGFTTLEDLAQARYSPSELAHTGREFTYTLDLVDPGTLVWAYGWCAADEAHLEENWQQLALRFELNGAAVPLSAFHLAQYDAAGQVCRVYYAGLTGWLPGEHHAATTVTFNQPVDDGRRVQLAGTQRFEYTIYVSP